jgi:hypothetical protein
VLRHGGDCKESSPLVVGGLFNKENRDSRGDTAMRGRCSFFVASDFIRTRNCLSYRLAPAVKPDRQLYKLQL